MLLMIMSDFMYFMLLMIMPDFMLWKQYLCLMVIDRNVCNGCTFSTCPSFSYSDPFYFFLIFSIIKLSLRPEK